jgi:hypothetical protein
MALCALIAGSMAACAAAPSHLPGTSLPSALDPTPVPVATLTVPESATPPPSQSARVSLLIYSGRIDPSWALTADETAKLADVVSALPVVRGEVPQGGLGYHGFAVQFDQQRDGSILIVTAYAKTIAPAGGGTFWRDDNGVVERFLLETGRPSLTAAEYAIAKQALDDLLR